jgi:hypothetical protein
MYSYVNRRNAANDSEFYLRVLRFNVTSTGNAGCIKMKLTMVL